MEWRRDGIFITVDDICNSNVSRGLYLQESQMVKRISMSLPFLNQKKGKRDE
jgi:hypothetical protein